MFQTSKRIWTRVFFIFLATGMLGICLSPCTSAAAATSHQDVKKVQENLNEQGYYHGHIDGLMGPQTRAAIRKYQKAEHLPVTGYLGASTASKLGVSQESVGGSFKNAGKAVGKGSEEAGHEMKEGKPIASGKEFGKGMGRFGKDIGKGVKKAVSPDTKAEDQKNK